MIDKHFSYLVQLHVAGLVGPPPLSDRLEKLAGVVKSDTWVNRIGNVWSKC